MLASAYQLAVLAFISAIFCDMTCSLPVSQRLRGRINLDGYVVFHFSSSNCNA